MHATILLIFAFVFDIIAITAVSVGLKFAFGGQYIMLRGFLTIAFGFVLGAFIGKLVGRRLLYVSLKHTYKKQGRKEKGETK